MITQIKNGLVMQEGGGFCAQDLWVRDDRVVAGADTPDRVIDASGNFILPGMIDIHIHGCAGVDFAQKGNFDAARVFAAKKGVTAMLPTVRTMTLAKMDDAVQNILDNGEKMDRGASLPGIHLEGPFISHQKGGAMRATQEECSVENFKKLLEAGQGKIKIMTIAPDRENALDVIRYGSMNRVRMSVGHTTASYALATEAFAAGATGATHLFNAMQGFSHREPGTLGAALTNDGVVTELIADFVHSAPASVKLAYRMKGCEHLILVSDGGAAVGMPDGPYVIDGGERIKQSDRIITPDGTLAGSVFTLYDDACNLLSMGVPLDKVMLCAAENPAKAAGIFESYGSLKPGKYADILITDQMLHLQRVFVGGKEIER